MGFCFSDSFCLENFIFRPGLCQMASTLNEIAKDCFQRFFLVENGLDGRATNMLGNCESISDEPKAQAKLVELKLGFGAARTAGHVEILLRL